MMNLIYQNKYTLSTKDKILKIILNNLNPLNQNFLDLGPGSGRWLDYIKKFSPNKIYAADFNIEIKKKCKKKVDEFKIMNFENEKDLLKLKSEIISEAIIFIWKQRK